MFLRQQAVLAKFGELALRSENVDEILTEACRLVGEALETDLAKVMYLLEDGETLLVRAGVGWKPGIVGQVTVIADKGSSEGYALRTGEPVASKNIDKEDRFTYAQFIKDHGVKALVNVIIMGGTDEKPFGLLQVDSRSPRDFDDGDIDFLRGYANLIAAAVDRLRNLSERERAESLLRESEERLQTLVSGIPQMVWRAVGIGIWTWASPQWTQFTGQDEVASHELGWLDCVHPEDRDAAMRNWEKAINSGRYEADYRLCNPASGQYRWFQTRATPVRDGAGEIVEWLGTSTDVDDLRAMQERQAVLVTELQHRTFNLLGTVRSISNETIRSSDSLNDFRIKFFDRIDALARVQRLLSRISDTNRVTFDELIGSEIAAMGSIEEINGEVTLEGPSGVALRSSTVQAFAMALHELATNALKYGALKQRDAHLSITWRVETEAKGRPWLHVDWRESGVSLHPADIEPQGTGQGRMLIEQALPYQLGAKTTFVLEEDGVRCSIALPVSSLSKIEEGSEDA